MNKDETALSYDNARLWEELAQAQAERDEWRERAERTGDDMDLFDLAYQDLMERLCAAFDCPNPNAIVDHIQALFEMERTELAAARAALEAARAIVKTAIDQANPEAVLIGTGMIRTLAMKIDAYDKEQSDAMR